MFTESTGDQALLCGDWSAVCSVLMPWYMLKYTDMQEGNACWMISAIVLGEVSAVLWHHIFNKS